MNIVQDSRSSVSPSEKNECAGTGRILAVDYGSKKIGLALSDPLRLTAQPFNTRVRTNRETDVKYLRDICRENRVTLIIVGNPLHLNGKISEMAEEATRFATRLNKRLGIPVELVDERLTTWEAYQNVRENGISRRVRPLDEIAASILLREYLARMSQTASPTSSGGAR